MEKIETYRSIIHRLLAEHHDLLASHTKTDVDTETVSDDAHGQYMVMRVGWRGETRVRRPLFYLRLKDGRIRVEEDWTEEGIACELSQAGVPTEDIILAFYTPQHRATPELGAA